MSFPRAALLAAFAGLSAGPMVAHAQTPPAQQMPTVTGPRPPPSIVVIPLEIASSHSPALSKWT